MSSVSIALFCLIASNLVLAVVIALQTLRLRRLLLQQQEASDADRRAAAVIARSPAC